MGDIFGMCYFKHFFGCLKFLIFLGSGGWTVNAGPERTYEEKWEYQPLWLKTGVLDKRPGAVLSFFSSYVGSGPASTVHPPKKYQEFQAPQL